MEVCEGIRQGWGFVRGSLRAGGSVPELPQGW